MNKSERLNDQIIYLNRKSHFNLKDLMTRYQISKRTALRDIQSLEQLGMPFYTELGRNGRYELLENRLLSPIIFNESEVFALYFCMLTLESYQSTPFHTSAIELKKKFEKCLSPAQKNKLKRMSIILRFESNQHHQTSPLLQQVLTCAIEEKVVSAQYCNNHKRTTHLIQFYDITAKFGQWYASAIDIQSNRMRVLRCDKIETITVSKDSAPLCQDRCRLKVLTLGGILGHRNEAFSRV